MKKLIISALAFLTINTFCHSSDYYRDDKYLSLVNHLVDGWESNCELTKDLKKELIGKESSEILDILADALWLCPTSDSADDKVSVALTFAMKQANDRHQVAQLSWVIKSHYEKKLKPRPVIDIIWSLFFVPAYQRETLCQLLIQPEAINETNMCIYAEKLVANFGYAELAAMYFHHKLIHPLSSTIWSTRSNQSYSRPYGKNVYN